MTQGKWFQLFVLLCLPIMLIVGCNPIIGSDWTLVSLNGHEVLPETTVTASFGSNSLIGFSGCNTYTVAITSLTGDKITIDDAIAHTEQFCAPKEGEEGLIMEQEEEFFQTLPHAKTYTLSNEQLEIKNEAGEVILVFTKGTPENLRY